MASKLWSTMESASLVATAGSPLDPVLFPPQTSVGSYTDPEIASALAGLSSAVDAAGSDDCWHLDWNWLV